VLYADADGDGYGAGGPVACGGVAKNTDCNDCDASVHSPKSYYRDADGDGFGNAGSNTSVCSSIPPTGYVTSNTDCDDTHSSVHPGAMEVCDGIDNNCDGRIDEGFTDTDHDGQADCVDTDDDGDGVQDGQLIVGGPVHPGVAGGQEQARDADGQKQQQRQEVLGELLQGGGTLVAIDRPVETAAPLRTAN